MRIWAAWVAALVAALGLVATLTGLEVIAGGVAAVLYGAVVFAAGIGTHLIARRRRAAKRSNAQDSIEREIAQRAGAAAFSLALVVMAGLAAVAAIRGELELVAWCYAAVAVTLAGYGMIYTVLRRRML